MILGKPQSASQAVSRQERLDALIANVQAAGYRLTNQRQAVLQALVLSERHPAAEDLYRDVRVEHPSISRATVYKTLEMLREMGEVLELEFRVGSNPANRYDGVRPYDHPHLVCTVCGAVEDLLVDPLHEPMEDVLKSTGYQLERYRLDLYGRCPRCREATKIKSHVPSELNHQ